MADRAALQLSGITKSFGGTRALVRGDLELFAGEVTALLGENGAGKSTLVKVLTGVHQPDAGEIRVDGNVVRIGNPRDAQRLGISVIHQESVTFDDLSVAENVFINAAPLRRGLIDWRGLQRRARTILEKLELRVDPGTPLRNLSVAQKHIVQIARALCHDARIVVMDEPTAALSKHEADDLLRIVRDLRSAGCAILYISHKFEEVFALADRYAVFRDGAAVGAGLMSETDYARLLQLMVGRPMGQGFDRQPVAHGDVLLRVADLSRHPEFEDVSFEVRAGEVLGIYGLVGAGRSEVMRALFGITHPDRGRVEIAGAAVEIVSPRAAVAAGIAYVPEDRQGQGAILTRSIAQNIALPSLASYVRRGLLSRDLPRASARDWVARLGVKCRDVDQDVQALSGGNQQKVVLAKWLHTAPRVLLLDEPTKGIDIAAKAAVHHVVDSLAAQGVAVVLVSSELPEVMALADRVLVMRRGRVSGAFARGGATAEDILRVATDA